MMVRRTAIASILLAILATAAQAGEWKVDPAHTSVGFQVSHLVISRVHGEFKDFDAKLVFDDSAIEKGSVEFTAKTASINTDNEDRDKHLRSSDFLDAEEYAVITFKSRSIIREGASGFKLIGDLTIRGVTKEVTFDCEFNGTVKDPWGNTKAGFSAETTINRQDFNVSWSKTLDSGGLMVGNEVRIMIEAEFTKVS